jgi:2-dehydro-3-deoxygalactonokinase
MSKPESVSARLFRLRANDLLHGASPDTARATLSGLLIGTELAAARPYWLGQQVAVIGADQISQAYVTALELQGMHAIHARADAMTLSGLIAAHKDMKATA